MSDQRVRFATIRVQWLVIGATVGLSVAAVCEVATAQQPIRPQTPLPTAGQPPVSAPSVVDSPEWQATAQAFRDWLSVQQIYTDEEVQKKVNDLRLRVAAMNEQERAAFLRDMQARLTVLNSDDARQARAWLGETMSRLTPAGQQQLRSQLPDVANMSAGQLQQSLADRQLQMQQRERNRAAATQLRTQQNQMAMQMGQQRQAAFTEARQRQQAAVTGQATTRTQQGFQQSQQNFRDQQLRAAAGNDPLFSPYIWANPWIW